MTGATDMTGPSDMGQTASGRIADWVAGLQFSDLPPQVVDKASVMLLHNLGVALAATSTAPVGPAYARAVHRAPEGTGARLWGGGERVSVEGAAYANATLMHARTQDDGHVGSQTHVSTVTLPAVLALAESMGASGQDVVTAAVAGWETVAAVATGFAPVTTARGFRASALYGPFAAAAACAKLLGCTAEQVRDALGLAATFAAGTNQTWSAGTMEWQHQVGLANRNGLMAALLASEGVSAAPDSLEGAAGFYQAFAGTTDGADQVGSALGQQWETLAVVFKPFPICAINQSPVYALRALARDEGLREVDVESVTLWLAPMAAAYPGVDSRGPFSSVGGTLMSAQYCLAAVLRHGNVLLAHLNEFDDAGLMESVNRVDIRTDESLSMLSSRVEVRTVDGRVLMREHDAEREPFDFDAAEDAALIRSLAPELPLSAEAVEALIATALRVTELKSVAELIDRCVVPTPATV